LKKEQKHLASLLKTTQLQQTGIRSILDTAMQPSLRQVLKEQLSEYDRIESEVFALAAQRGWELRELDPAVRFISDRFMRMKLGGNSTDSKIADMLILGNTRGMIESTRTLHQISVQDKSLRTLSQKLLDCEHTVIRQMQIFL